MCRKKTIYIPTTILHIPGKYWYMKFSEALAVGVILSILLKIVSMLDEPSKLCVEK